VTIVAQHRACWCGRIVDGEMVPSPAGQMVVWVWRMLPERFPRVQVDATVLMPNHLHAMVHLLPEGGDARVSLSEVVGWFKGVTTTRYGGGVRGEGWPPYDGHLWQPSFHDRVVRDRREKVILAAYIEANPARWDEDTFHEPDTFAPVHRVADGAP
jgi:REP element-mobilizing transposase RayT